MARRKNLLKCAALWNPSSWAISSIEALERSSSSRASTDVRASMMSLGDRPRVRRQRSVRRSAEIPSARAKRSTVQRSRKWASSRVLNRVARCRGDEAVALDSTPRPLHPPERDQEDPEKRLDHRHRGRSLPAHLREDTLEALAHDVGGTIPSDEPGEDGTAGDGAQVRRLGLVADRVRHGRLPDEDVDADATRRDAQPHTVGPGEPGDRGADERGRTGRRQDLDLAAAEVHRPPRRAEHRVRAPDDA